jgi:hypothetical protein
MSKEVLKETIKELQNGICKLSGQTLPKETFLFDTHRAIPKERNGIYTIENTGVVIPIEHMKQHGTFKQRNPLYEELKAIVDDRNQTIKLKLKIENQLRAYARSTDILTNETCQSLHNCLDLINPEVKKKDKMLKSLVRDIIKKDLLAQIMINVKGIGEVTIAYCLVYLDINKARHISSFWKYAGLHTASHMRYQKGKAGGGNKSLRSQLYCMAESQIKCAGPYSIIYYQTKERLKNSNKPVNTCITRGMREVKPWKDVKPCHRDGAAKRKMMKYFLADLWIVWRTILDLPIENAYPVDYLGNHKMSLPKERGWKY